MKRFGSGIALAILRAVPCAPAFGDFVRDVPPRASLIQLSAPDGSGIVKVTGGPGSIAGPGIVVLVNLDTGDTSSTQATTDGSFSASLFAPAGASILIKADPLRTTLVNNLTPLVGTILRVPDPVPAADGVPFTGAGAIGIGNANVRVPPVWTFEGTVNGQTFQPGDVNVLVPDGAPPGDAVPVALTIGGAGSNTVTIAIQNNSI
jgi:hypothetical protein